MIIIQTLSKKIENLFGYFKLETFWIFIFQTLESRNLEKIEVFTGLGKKY
jgi:hypothetical protein